MRKVYLFFLLLLFNQLNAQNTTYVPDNNFENYLETHNSSGAIVPLGDPTSMGDGILNDSVLTSNIINVNLLDVSGLNISVLTGIEDFSSLTSLNCDSNLFNALDISNNQFVFRVCAKQRCVWLN